MAFCFRIHPNLTQIGAPSCLIYFCRVPYSVRWAATFFAISYFEFSHWSRYGPVKVTFEGVYVSAYHSRADSLQAHGAGSKGHEILYFLVSRNASSVVITSEKRIYHMNTVDLDLLRVSQESWSCQNLCFYTDILNQSSMICAPRYCGQSTFCEMCISKYKAEEKRDCDYQMGSVWDWDGDYCADHE